MRLKDFESNGVFVSDEPVKRPIEWKKPNGEVVAFDVLIKRVTLGDLEARLTAHSRGESVSALTISQSIILPDSAEGLSYEQARRLDPTFSKVLLDAIKAVNTADAEEASKN